jgi:hypothetical protein
VGPGCFFVRCSYVYNIIYVGANAAIQNAAKSPTAMIAMVDHVIKKNGYKYVLVGGGYSNLARSETDVASVCTDFEVGSFMLGMVPGCFLICQGWDEDFARCEKRRSFLIKKAILILKRSFYQDRLGTISTTYIGKYESKGVFYAGRSASRWGRR